MTPDQLAKWRDPARTPFRLFQSLEEELAAPNSFWRSRSPEERMEYLEFMRCVVYGEEVINAGMIRCYGAQKLVEGEFSIQTVVYF